MTEEVLAGGHRTRIELRERRLQMVVERIARFLVPEERIVAQHLRISDRRFEVEASVRIDGELRAVSNFIEHRFDALSILFKRRAADLHLDDAVAALEIAAHFGTQRIIALAGVVIAAGGVDEHVRLRLNAVAFREQPKQRLAGDLRDRIPHRHIERPHRHRSFAVTARLFVGHHRGPHTIRIEILAAPIEQRCRIGLAQSRREALANQPALAIPSVGVEAVANHATAVALDIGHDCHKTRRHLREVDVRVADGRCNRLGDFANIDDADRHDGCSFRWQRRRSALFYLQ